MNSVVALMAFVALGASATTVAVYRTNTQLVIAADSLFSDVSDGGIVTHRQGCKIFVGRNYFYSFAGVARWREAELDVPATIANTFQDKNMQSSCSHIAAKLSGRLLHALQSAYVKLPRNTYQELMASGPNPLSIVIAQMVRNVPTVAFIDFVSQRNSTGRPTGVTSFITICPRPKCDAEYCSVIGRNRAVAHGCSFSGDPIADGRRVIEIEIADQPRSVGPPIDILVINAAGHHWVKPYGACDAGGSAPFNAQ